MCIVITDCSYHVNSLKETRLFFAIISTRNYSQCDRRYVLVATFSLNFKHASKCIHGILELWVISSTGWNDLEHLWYLFWLSHVL